MTTAVPDTVPRDATIPTQRLATISETFLPLGEAPPVLWSSWEGLTDYAEAVAFMEKRVAGIAARTEPETVLLVEHPPLYTAGTSAVAEDLVDPTRFPVYATGRGGEYTYHGPGQRVAYVMLDLKRRRQDVRAFVAALEAWVIGTLGEMQVRGERREDRVGVWVRRPERAPLADGTPAEDKIAAIGIRLRKWVTFHGISLNVDPDLSHFGGIVPCGVRGYGVTSLVDLGLPVAMADVDMMLRRHFEAVFGKTQAEPGQNIAAAEQLTKTDLTL